MSDSLNIEINGISLQVKQGKMLIEAADEAGIVIPRFCYHKKLSVAANCRMCLVEVEKAPKPLPACATPVMDGMIVHTKSAKAIEAQKSVMEFLLINHPLDCPICDQGGECELQDVAMGYGGDVSRFAEQKRVVKNKNLGSLISTDMTRCIHCTRCVRFGQEVAGIMELGAHGRGEHTEIGTYMERAVSSEMSGNVIDLCPVGALTSKPYRYSGRPWENQVADSIAPHDCMGSNIKVETRRDTVMRVVPHENEMINEMWLSDRDRFSYTALSSDERLTKPMIKQGDDWKEVDWEAALSYVVEGLKRVSDNNGANSIGGLASPSSTTEELYLFQKWLRGIGVENIDHRLQQIDFSGDANAPLYPYLGQTVAELEENNAVLLVGSYIRKDQPIASHRIKKAVRNGARVSAINSIVYDFNFELAQSLVVHPLMVVNELAAIAKALAELNSAEVPAAVKDKVNAAEINDAHRAIAKDLNDADNATVLMGLQAQSNPHFSAICSLSNLIAQMSNSKLGYLSFGANSAGASLAGVLPYAGPIGEKATQGKNTQQMLEDGQNAFVLLNVEPEFDCANPGNALSAVKQADFVVNFTSFVTDAMKDYADVLLPITPFTETAGTFVNAAGQWQSSTASVQPLAESRPAWKVLRVLGNFSELPGFDYITSEDVRGELDTLSSGMTTSSISEVTSINVDESKPALMRIGYMPIYAVDSVVRRSEPLQKTSDAMRALIAVNNATASKLGINQGEQAIVKQNNQSVHLPIVIEDAVPDDCAFIPTGVLGSDGLGISYGPVEVIAG